MLFKPAGIADSRITTTTQSARPDALSTEQPKVFEDPMLEIEHEVPGFAGFTANGTTLQVRSTTRDIDMNALKTAIVSRWPQLAGSEIEIVDVPFDFGQLSAWYQMVQDAVFSAPEVTSHVSMTGIDEGNNRITIGVDTEAARQGAEQRISSLGLPPGAVEVLIRPFAVPD